MPPNDAPPSGTSRNNSAPGRRSPKQSGRHCPPLARPPTSSRRKEPPHDHPAPAPGLAAPAATRPADPAAADPTAAPVTEPATTPETTYPTPQVSDFALKVKVLEKTNFGSAGSNITYRIVA